MFSLTGESHIISLLVVDYDAAIRMCCHEKTLSARYPLNIRDGRAVDDTLKLDLEVVQIGNIRQTHVLIDPRVFL